MKPLTSKNPLVSVIIPNYNHAKYLDERIQSVLNQTYQNFEVIILDDLSTDNSKEVIEKYRNAPHVSQIVYNEKNSGSTFKQWLKGMELAKGNLIWIAESDDSCEREMLEKLVAEFSKDENLVLAFCNSMIIDENDNKKYVIQPKKWRKDIHCLGQNFIKEYLCIGNIIFNASSALFRKDVALKLNTQYTQYKGSGDWLFWIELCEKGHVSMLKQPMNKFRKHYGNVTTLAMSNGTQQIENKRIFEYIRDKDLISSFNKLKVKVENLYSFKYVIPFENESIKENVVKLWSPNSFDLLLVQVKRIHIKLKDFIKKAILKK